MTTHRFLVIALLALGGIIPARAGFAQDEARRAVAPATIPNRTALESRLAAVQTLIERSSAAREIEASAKPEALARRDQARQTLRLGAVALAAGDLRAAGSLLEDAARELIAAARTARDVRAHDHSEQREIGLRMESARALLAAQRRISVEKPDAGALGTVARIDTLLEEAQGHLDAHRYGAARPLADQAYLLAKASVSAMRRGDTLVRSLSFASKEEEYRYEIDRNDTHRMLVTLLARRQGGDAAPGRDVTERAQALRREAEARAARGDFAESIRLLEDSTRELVRAIRGAGMFIPG